MSLDTRLLAFANAVSAEVKARFIPRKQYLSGLYYSAPGQRANASRPNGFETYLPMLIEANVTIVGVNVVVITAGHADSTLRVGIYGDVGGKPGPLLAEVGVISTASSGVKTLALPAPLTLSPRWVHLAAAVQNSATAPLAILTCATNAVPGAPMVATQHSQSAGWATPNFGQGALAATASSPVPADTCISIGLLVGSP